MCSLWGKTFLKLTKLKTELDGIFLTMIELLIKINKYFIGCKMLRIKLLKVDLPSVSADPGM